MLGNLFKPRWQHRDPAVRAQAAAQLDPSDEADILGRLAREDTDPGVRAAACAGLLDLAVLDGLIRQDPDQRVRESASERIMALLAGSVAGGPDRQTRLHLIRHTDNPRVLAHVARQGDDTDSRHAALESITDPALLFELAVSGQDEALRLAAAGRLDDPALLRRLGREGRDKRVVRHARERVKALQRDEAEQHQRHEQLEQVVEGLVHLARGASDPLFDARLQQLEQRWTELAEHADDGQRQRVTAALETCHAHQRRQREAAHREQRRRDAEEQSAAALDTLEALLRDVGEDTWDDQLGALRSVLDTQQRRWQEAREDGEPEASRQHRFDALLAQWRQLVGLAEAARASEEDQTLRDLAARWPSRVPAPRRLRLIREALIAEKNEEKREREQARSETAAARREKHRPESAHRGLVVALRRELQHGNLKHANRLWHKAEGVLGEESDPWLARQLERLRERRDELRDWHAFAAQPKKDQLCERMEALSAEGADLDPEELATAIQALHDEWRELMSSDQDQDQALWDRFKVASDRAYEPCRAHFAELDERRAENLQKRRALCEQLAGFIDNQDWDGADWQAVWEIRRRAPREWQGYAPVRFTEVRDLQKRFSALLSDLDERLDHAWQDAEAERQRLIDQAATLSELEDVHEATRQARELQQHWRTAPWLPPARHRRFQKAFRRIMDRLFAAREAANEARNSERREARDQAETRLNEAEARLARPLPEQDRNDLMTLAADLDRLTPALDRDAQKRARRLQDQLGRLRIELPRWQRWQGALTGLAEAAVGDATDGDATLAVALEVLAGVESPESARQKRMAWQLEQLPRMMKTADFAPLDEALMLVAERPDGALDPALRERMESALKALEPGRG